ncbi:MAG: hypothetical protein KAK00_04845 [Nanoarchaeota archaeon]|nr:hypothetical protein [Nanoarchaeota archaeon]
MEDNNQEDEEITIDFSKIKNFFKKKAEKDKIESVEKKADIIKKKIDSQLDRDEILKKDQKKVEEIKTELKKEESEAAIVEGEERLIEKKVRKEERELERIEEDIKDDSDEEISFDFKKIGGFFKSLKKNITKDKHETDDEDEISFDFKKTIEIVKRYNVLLLILIPLIFSVYLRLMPAYLPATEEWARNNIYSNIRNQINSQVRAEYPNLPQANINRIVDNNLAEFEKTNKEQIKQETAQVAAYFKSRLQKNGQTYLIAIDPYFWMRHARNVLENGHPGDELRNRETKEVCYEKGNNCIPWDIHMLAPFGRDIPPDMFHAYLEAYTHKFLSIFNPNQDLMGSCFYVPIILSALCILPAFFIARRIGGNFGGFIAALFIAIHPAFLTRTVGGFADTDAYNVLFPLFITWLFLEAFETKSWKKGLILSSISGLIVSIYTITWIGWWYIFDFIIASTVIYLAIYLLINRNNIRGILKHEALKHTIIVLLAFFLSSFLFTTMMGGTFMAAFDGPFGFMRFKEVGITTVWPNVFTTVAEQNPASLNSVIGQIGTGSLLLFLLSILGIVLTLVKKDSKDKKDLYYFILSAVWLIIVLAIRPQNLIVFLSLIALPIIIKIVLAIYNKDLEIDFKPAIILIIWFTATIYASTKGIRFMLLLVPAFSLGLGIAFGYIYKHLSVYISKGLYLNKTIAKTVVIIVLLLMLINPVNTARNTAKQEIPSMNSAWYESLDKINREAEPDAIINSWWDFGHWFKAIGDRAVTFDGTSQGTPMAHWIGHSLLTNDEEKAIGILRMLDCGSNTAFRKLNEDIDDTARSVYMLHDIVKMDKREAKEYLLDHVDEEKAEEVLRYSHCEPPENYYITSDDMVGKSGVWGHFGIWNFNRALIYNVLNKKEYKNDKEKSTEFLKERFNYSEDKAESIFYEVKGIQDSNAANSWIAPWPSYASGVTGCRNEGEIIICPINLQGGGGSVNMQINLENKTAEINTPNGKFYPNALVYPTEKGIEKIEFSNNTLGYGMALIPSGDSWNYIMMLSPLEDSMYTRLYFLNGHGLKGFDKFSEQKSVIGNRIVVWKVDWEGEDKNLVYFQEEEEETIEEDITEELIEEAKDASEEEEEITTDKEVVERSEEILEEYEETEEESSLDEDTSSDIIETARDNLSE